MVSTKKKIYLAGCGSKVSLYDLIRYRCDYGKRLRELGYAVLDPYAPFVDRFRDIPLTTLEQMPVQDRDKLIFDAINAAAKVDAYFRLLSIRAKGSGLGAAEGKSLRELGTAKQVEEIERLDALRLSQCDAMVAYLPQDSKGTVREANVAGSLGMLRFAFGTNERILKQTSHFFDASYPSFEDLVPTLEFYNSGESSYLTTAPVSAARGHMLIYSLDVSALFPHILAQVTSTLAFPRCLFSFCCERSHIHELAQKLPVMLRLGTAASITVLTKDGSPHDVQMHTLVQEVIDNSAYPCSVDHLVVERARLHRAPSEAVKTSRHLHTIAQLLGTRQRWQPEATQTGQGTVKKPSIAVLVGGKSDLATVEASGLRAKLCATRINYTLDVVSSDREPERLRKQCLANAGNWDVVIAIAGGVPNLPVVVKSWLPATPVISVPVSDDVNLAMAALTTPSDVPVILSGYGERGVRKAGALAVQLLKWRMPVEDKSVESYLHGGKENAKHR